MSETSARWAIAIHGGAGAIAPGQLKPEQEAAYRASLERIIRAGGEVLEHGGSALDAVEAAVRLLEDDPLYNSGRGAVFTPEGRNELDAAIMDGRTLDAGAVAGVTRAAHPITLARAVMERSDHVMLMGAGADAFAESLGVELVETGHFFTERRWKSLVRSLEDQGIPVPPRPPGASQDPRAELAHDEGKYGTVGAVAVDIHCHVAAATSTGGLTAKRWGRIGDSPVIGAGTYASDQACAVSATGSGEFFIRLAVAHEIAALVRHKGLSLQAATDAVIQDQLTALGGDGGVIAAGPDGALAWSFNTSGMYRARLAQGGALVIGVYKDDF